MGGGGRVSAPLPPTGNPVPQISLAPTGWAAALGVHCPCGQAEGERAEKRWEDWTMRGTRLVLLGLVLATCSHELGEGRRQGLRECGKAGRLRRGRAGSEGEPGGKGEGGMVPGGRPPGLGRQQNCMSLGAVGTPERL